MAHDIGFAAAGNENQVNGVPGRGAATKMDKGAVRNESGVERREREVPPVGVASEMGLERVGRMFERLAHAHHEDPIAGAIGGGQRRRESAVHEDEPAALVGAQARMVPDSFDAHIDGGLRPGPEGLFLERRQPGVLPVFVARAREAEILEACDSGFAHLLQPAPIAAWQGVAAFPEGVEVVRDGRGEAHVVSASSTIPA